MEADLEDDSARLNAEVDGLPRISAERQAVRDRERRSEIAGPPAQSVSLTGSRTPIPAPIVALACVCKPV